MGKSNSYDEKSIQHFEGLVATENKALVGKNVLGELLMEIREHLVNGSSPFNVELENIAKRCKVSLSNKPLSEITPMGFDSGMKPLY